MSSLIIRRGMPKLAAAEDGPSFEQQFGILANALIADKYPKLDRMKLAFQLIDKAEDNSKAVGAAVYLVGGTVIFVPAFYKNGKINTGDMMFLPKSQQFLPLSDPWLAWVQDKELQSAGQTVPYDQAERDGMQTAVTIKDISDPIVKTACVYLRGLLRTDPDLTKNASGHSLLDTVLGMGKRASEALLDNLISNNNFLNAALHFYSGDELDTFAKKAAALDEVKETVNVILPFTKEAKSLTPFEKEILDRDGYIIKMAAEDQHLPTVIRHKNVKDTFQKVSEPGKFELLKMDGSTRVCLVMRLAELSGCDEIRCSLSNGDVETYGEPGMNAAKFMNNTKDTSGLIAFITADAKDGFRLKPDTMMLATPENKPFEPAMIANYGKSMTPANVKEIWWGDNLLCPDGYCYNLHMHMQAREEGWYNSDNFTVIVSEDPKQISPIVTSSMIIIPQKSRFIGRKHEDDMTVDSEADELKSEVKGKHSMPFVTWNAIDVFLSEYVKKKYNKVRVTSNGSEMYISGDRSSEDRAMSVKEASLHLVKDYGIEPGVVRNMLSEVNAGIGGNVANSELYLIDKRAFEDPDWKKSDLGMSEFMNRPEQREFVQMPTVLEDPQQLQQAVMTAAENGIKDVFDVTAFKLLVRQNRFLEEIHDDLPMFMRVLDSLCRKLFLLYWHTEDFEDQYGTVKLKSLEESLKTTLDSLSEITVFFKLRNASSDDMGVGNDGGELMRGYDMS